jgi:hypothetical protein
MRLIIALFDDILSEFKWYRRRKGGSWYRVIDPADAGGMHSPTPFWTQEPDNLDVLKEEHY